MEILDVIDDFYTIVVTAAKKKRKRRNKIMTRVPEFWRQNFDYDGINFIDKLLEHNDADESDVDDGDVES
jgi:hypothetical protein